MNKKGKNSEPQKRKKERHIKASKRRSVKEITVAARVEKIAEEL